MKIKTKELKKIFEKVKIGLSQKGFVEQQKNITFDGKYVFTYSGSIGVFLPFETDFACSVPAQEFMKIISDISDNEVEFDLSDNKLRLKGKGVDVDLNVLTDINDSEKVINKNIRFRELPKDFMKGVDLCSFAASKDTNSKFNGIFVSGKDIFGSDDLRISYFEMEEAVKVPFLIPLSSAISLKGFNLKKYGIEDGWIYFEDTDGVMFCSRLLEPEYDEPSQHFIFDGTQITFPEDIKKLVEKAEILSEGDFDVDRKIIVRISGNKLTCIGDNEVGKISAYTEISGKDDEDNIEFVINPIFFRRILNETNTAIISEDRIMFSIDNFKHLISLYCGDE